MDIRAELLIDKGAAETGWGHISWQGRQTPPTDVTD